MYNPTLVLCAGIIFASYTNLSAENWPAYQHDNQRSGVSGEKLPTELHLQWLFTSPAAPAKGWAKPSIGYGAYKNKSNVSHDDAFRLIAVDGTVYFSSSAENTLFAVESASGTIRWRHFTSGTPRLAPAYYEGHLIYGDDSGTVVSLDAATGIPAWTFQAAPASDMLLGHGRLSSVWPVRTGVTVQDGVAYCSAGLFTSEGVFLYALNAETGELIWRKELRDRNNEGPSPQGYPVVCGTSLFLTSRVSPTRWRLSDGSSIPFTTPVPKVKDAAYRYYTGGSYALAWKENIVFGQACILAFNPDARWKDKWGKPRSGQLVFNWFNARRAIFNGDMAYLATDYHLLAVEQARLPELAKNECMAFEEAYKKHRVATCRSGLEEIAEYGDESERGQSIKNGNLKYAMREYAEWPDARKPLFGAFEKKTAWMTPGNFTESMILVGQMLYAGSEGQVAAFSTSQGKQTWSFDTGSRVRDLAVEGGYLLVSCIDGTVRCFGGKAVAQAPVRTFTHMPPAHKRVAVLTDTVDATFLKTAQANLVTLISPPGAIPRLRRKLADASLLGHRVEVLDQRSNIPPYIYKKMIAERNHPELKRLVHSLSPGDGMLELTANGKVESLRRGYLEGARDWTHNYANPGNTYCSEDRRVKGPFGVLWFGEPGPRKRINRHSRPPLPIVVKGRMFLTGYDLVMCYDVYNGTRYWERWLPGATRENLPFGTSNIVAGPHKVYVVTNNQLCHQLDRNTGKTDKIFTPPIPEGEDAPRWGWLAYADGRLFGSRSAWDEKRKQARPASSTGLFAFDAEEAKPLWHQHGYLLDHDGIALDQKHLYFANRIVTDAERALALSQRDASTPGRQAVDRKGQPILPDVRMLTCLDAANGTTIWKKPIDLSDLTLDDTLNDHTGGPGVLCMVKDGVLVVCGVGSIGHPYKDYRAGQFSRRSIFAFDASDGKRLWGGRKNYRKRPVIVGDRVYAEPFAWDLHSGADILEPNPATGLDEPLNYLRGYSRCGAMLASGAALFGDAGTGGVAHYNLEDACGYTPFGNLALSCGVGAVPANGLFIAPEGRTGCACSTAIYTSIVLYPRQKARAWSYSPAGAPPAKMTPVKEVCINFGAPGHRRDRDGRLWIGYAGVNAPGSYSEWLPRYKHGPEDFYYQSSDLLNMEDTDIPWVYSCGFQGTKELKFRLRAAADGPAPYTIELYFAEPEPGSQRRFNVWVQNQQVAEGINLPGEAGGIRKALVRRFPGVTVKEELVLRMEGDKPIISGLKITRE